MITDGCYRRQRRFSTCELRFVQSAAGEELRAMTSNAAADTTAAGDGAVARDVNASADDMMTSAIDVIDKYVTPVWYVVGVPGNLLAFVVWTQKKMRASSGCYLAALAFNDCLFLLLQVSRLSKLGRRNELCATRLRCERTVSDDKP